MKVDTETHRLVGIPYDASPHVGGNFDLRFIVMHYTAGFSALGPVKAWEVFPEAQLKAVEAITLALRAAYPRIQEVVGHDDIAPERKSDPGPAFPMARFQALGGAAGSGSLADDDLGEFEVVVGDVLNLRGGPGTGFAILGTLQYGRTLRVLREDGEWRLVDLDRDTRPDGFVHGAFLRRIGS